MNTTRYNWFKLIQFTCSLPYTFINEYYSSSAFAEINGIFVPASYHDALLIIKAGVVAGSVDFGSAHSYSFIRPDGKVVFSPVGCLLTADQLADIATRDIIDDCINALADNIGDDNVVAMTSMSIDQLSSLQNRFNEIADDGHTSSSDGRLARDAFVAYLDKQLQLPNFPNPQIM